MTRKTVACAEIFQGGGFFLKKIVVILQTGQRGARSPIKNISWAPPSKLVILAPQEPLEKF